MHMYEHIGMADLHLIQMQHKWYYHLYYQVYCIVSQLYDNLSAKEK